MAAANTLFSVAGKNVLITGGSRGIGLMIASTFVRHGANVLVTSRDPKACEEAARVLEGEAQVASSMAAASTASNNNTTVHHVSSNVSTREGCKALAQHTSQVFNGRLDVLVNNAGTSWGEDPGFDAGSRESGKMNWGWDKVMDLNVKGMFYLTRECVPMLQRRRIDDDDDNNNENGKEVEKKTTTTTTATKELPTTPPLDPGRIINVGSITGFLPQAAPTHAYDVSKAAVHHLTKKLSCDLAPRGITVNAIAPGYIPSRMSKGLTTWIEDDDDNNDITTAIGKTIPLGRMGNEDDMGGACVYLSSRAGAWCSGVILNVDGGSVGAMQIPLSNL